MQQDQNMSGWNALVKNICKPDAQIALVFEGTEVSYQALEQRADIAAAHLSQMIHQSGKYGPSPLCGDKPTVAVSLPRGPDGIVAVLAILKAECVCVPIDPTHPAPLKARMVAEAECALVVTDDIQDNWPRPVAAMAALEMPVDIAAPLPVAEDDLGFVLFTSGTTGDPKGVLLGLNGLIEAVRDFSGRTDLNATSVIAQYAGLSFDAAMFEILLAYLNHARLEIVPEDGRVESETLGDLIAARAVTHVILPAAVVPYVPIRDDYALHALVCVGDVLDDGVFAAWAERYPTFNGYGPTEASICASLERVSIGKPVTLGQPLCHVSFATGGDNGDELLISGRGLARGYLNAPELTGARFRKGPDGKIWYHTGDIVRQDAGGNFIFAGRNDFQAKIRGVRVEVSAIEMRLRSISGVTDAVVVVAGSEGEGQTKYLAAFIASTAGQDQIAKTARDLIEIHLPASHMPSVFQVDNRLPMTVNQKVDRRALLDRLTTIKPLGRASADQVRSAFAAAVHATTFDETDSFFHLGGDSIGAMRLLENISQIVGHQVPVRAFRQNPTMKGLKALILDSGPRETVIETGLRTTDILPLSHQQNAAWYMFQQDPDSKAYHAEAVHHFDGPLDETALTQALQTLFDRHEIYRTIFFEQDGVPIQKILPNHTPSIQTIDAIDIEHDARDDFLKEVFRDHLPGINDLGQLPLARFALVRFSDNYHAFLHQEHHIVHDGWGGSEFTTELINWYHHFSDGDLEYTPQTPAQYADFMLTQEVWMGSEQAQGQKEYWQTQLAGAPQSVAIFGKKSSAPGFDGGHCRLDVTRADWEAFETTARDLGVTVFGLTTAVLNIVLSRFSGQSDIVIGAPFANRNWQNSRDILGMVVNTVVLRQSVDDDNSLIDFIRATQVTIDAAYTHQEYPFGAVVEAVNPERFGGQNPLFNVLLGFHDAPITVPEVEGFQWRKDETVISHTSKFDLDCLVVNRASHFTDDNRVSFLWEYRADVYDAAEIEQFIASFRHVFHSLIDDQSGKVGDVSAVTRDQIALMQGNWGRGLPPLAQHTAIFENSSLAETLSDVLHQNSDAIALQTRHETLSYADLYAQSGNVAAAIADTVGPNDRVAVFAKRGIAQIVAMTAALRLGATIVCVDPAQPHARLRQMIKDSQPMLVLCDDIDTAALGEVRQILISDARGVDAALPPRTIQSDHIAYVTYTSGSTGQPKGVEVYATGLKDECLHLMQLLELNRNSVSISLSFTGFDAYQGEVWPVLCAGGTLLILSDEERDNLPQLSRIMEQFKVSSACFPTGLLEQACATKFEWPVSLQVLATGGDRLGTVQFPDTFSAKFYNLYGPTETTVDATWYAVPRHAFDAPAIGRPAVGTTARVLDGNRPVPPGGPGELIIGGTGVAKGYLDQPEETAKSFVTLPNEGPARFYRTGDKVRWRIDGQLEFLGRIDDEISLRGYRIAPAEINAAVQAHPTVAQSAVAVRSNALFVYVVLRLADVTGPTSRITRQIKVHLKNTLPKYMRPNAIMVMDRLPLTQQGKVDIAALPSPLEETTVFETAATTTETALLGIWKSVLPAEQISVTQNFFSIGGHSLLAMRMIASIRDTFEVTLKITDFFERGTIRELSEQIDLVAGQSVTDAGTFTHEGEF